MSKNKNKNKKKQQNQSQYRPPYKQPIKPAPEAQVERSTTVPPSGEVKPQKVKMRSLEQERAADALRKVRDLSNGSPGYYVSYVSALPATIVMNGLGQALVMLLAKAKGERQKEHYILYSHLASWLSDRVQGLSASSVDGVVEKLMQGDQDLYVRAQTEAMAYLHWLKQFARAYLSEKEGQGDS